MRMTHVRGYDPLRDEPGDERLDARLPFTGIALADIESALRIDHACPEFVRRHCDVCTALDHGFVLSALHLLRGATNSPATDIVCHFHERRRSLPSPAECDAEWDEWGDLYVELFPVRCRKCHSWNRAEAPRCHACRAQLPASLEISDE